APAAADADVPMRPSAPSRSSDSLPTAAAPATSTPMPRSGERRRQGPAVVEWWKAEVLAGASHHFHYLEFVSDFGLRILSFLPHFPWWSSCPRSFWSALCTLCRDRPPTPSHSKNSQPRHLSQLGAGPPAPHETGTPVRRP